MRGFGRALAVTLLLAASARAARADSDGYFCVGPNYVAYELSFSAGPEGHFFNLVALGGKDGILGPVKIKIPDFQVHGMACGKDRVELLGWEAIYVLDIRNPRSPALVDTRPLSKPGQSVDGIPAADHNLLAGWPTAEGVRASQSMALTSAEPGIAYRLDVTVGAFDSEKCEEPVVASIVRLDAGGKVTKRVTLISGKRHGECG